MHLELDAVRSLIVSGLADAQEAGAVQEEQYLTAVAATLALARAFAASGYDVAVDDVLEPERFERDWRPRLDGLDARVVIVFPSLEETLVRSRERAKRVREEHIRAQHARCAGWAAEQLVDTPGLTPAESLPLVLGVLAASR